jgi:hypothetical protein
MVKERTINLYPETTQCKHGHVKFMFGSGLVRANDAVERRNSGMKEGVVFGGEGCEAVVWGWCG